jgi:2,3-bisphosphoglycerate-dependent phosphoglycerate mutase
MRIFLVRHGFSEGNERQANYREKGDAQIELTDLGWQQAIAAGQFLDTFLAENPGDPEEKIRLWFSTLMRTRQTAAGLIEGSNGKILRENARPDSLLVEMDFGLFSHIGDKEEQEAHLPLHAEFWHSSRGRNKYYARPPMGESPHDVQHRTSTFIGRMMREKDNGINDVVVITHGVTLRALAMDFLKIDPRHYDDFDNPENCSIYLIEGDTDRGRKYSFHQIYNGETMKPVKIDWGKKLQIYESLLPQVPNQFKI